MNVRLSPELEEIIRERIASGAYRDESEVVARALSLLSEHDHSAALEAALDEGEADIHAGRFIETSTEEELRQFLRHLMRRLRWSMAARSDLSAIVRRSETQRGAAQRARYVGQLRMRLEQLRDRPELGPVYGAHRPGLRKLSVGAHVAFYRFDDERIIVVRILDQRMDVEAHLDRS